jgi:hypothetical protein
MIRKALYVSILSVALLLTGIAITGPTAKAIGASPSSFDVQFTNCVESIGVGLVPTEQARALVPPEFDLVGEGQPVTPIVVRTADCGGISVAGQRPKAGSIVQIGVVIVPPDFTGDINNYTLLYYTSDAKLANALQSIGLSAQQTPTIDYEYEPSGNGAPSPLHVVIRQPGEPQLRLDGTVIESSKPAGAFNANWWAKAGGAIVKMDTLVPQIFIGVANLSLTTNAGNPLGQLIGGGTVGFPALQQFNTFPNARMIVSVVTP